MTLPRRLLTYVRFYLAVFLAACVLCPSLALAQADAGNSRPDEQGAGAYPALKEEDPGLPDQVIYRPLDLDALGDRKLGVVAWGNGGCSFDGASSRFHLLELASHGYLVIAGGRIFSGPGAHDRKPVAEGGAAATHQFYLAYKSYRLGAGGKPAPGKQVLRAHRP